MKHLSSDAISEWILGERTEESERHVRECAQCKAQLDGFQSSLASFRDVMRSLPVPETQPTWRPITACRDFRWTALATLATVVLLLVVAMVPLFRARDNAHRQVAAAAQDAILLEQVNAAVSRSVPEPFEPLARLSAASDQTEKKESQ